MKNQYFGDVSDFLKYDLVLTLIERLDDTRGFVLISMLTPDDGSGNGGIINYDGGRRRCLEAFLKRCVRRDRRLINLRIFMSSMEHVEYRPYRDDEYFRHEEREDYFNSIDPRLLMGAVVLIDPDNGLEVKSMRRKNGHKYLRYGELRRVYHMAGDDSLIMVYQHIPRVKRETYFRETSLKIYSIIGAAAMWLSSSKIVLFILARDPGLGERAWQIIREYADENGYSAGRLAGPCMAEER
jgi:hypothetical protein